MSEVYVVTNPERGWDCVIAVFNADSVSKQHLEEVFSSDQYVIHWNNVDKDTIDYRDYSDD